MSGFDFNNTKEQTQSHAHGPVPDGSKVLIQVTINAPYKQASSTNSIVNVSKSGLFSINVIYTVASGTYEGYRWFDMIMLPPGQQKAAMTDGQRKACEISEQRVRALIEASRNVNPKDTSQQAKAKRSIKTWQDINEMTFPARLTINPKGRDYNGKTYYNNRISYIITPDNKEYNHIMSGGEIINEGGAVIPVGSPPKPQYQYDASAFSGSFENTGNMESSGLDDVPF